MLGKSFRFSGNAILQGRLGSHGEELMIAEMLRAPVRTIASNKCRHLQNLEDAVYRAVGKAMANADVDNAIDPVVLPGSGFK
jgi:hypothetical protein